MGEEHAAGEQSWSPAHKGSTYHENEENEEDKGCEVDGSKHWIGLLNF